MRNPGWARPVLLLLAAAAIMAEDWAGVEKGSLRHNASLVNITPAVRKQWQRTFKPLLIGDQDGPNNPMNFAAGKGTQNGAPAYHALQEKHPGYQDAFGRTRAEMETIFGPGEHGRRPLRARHPVQSALGSRPALESPACAQGSGACLSGMLPCNGLLYATPTQCACLSETKLAGWPHGRILAFDGEMVYGYGRQLGYIKWMTPVKQHLFAMKKQPRRKRIKPPQGGLLWVVDKNDGTKRGEVQLPAPPVRDGMAAADGHLIVSLTDGSLVCLGKLP